jgi:hypothetical protein
MPRVEFKPTIPEFERAKTFCALGRAVSVIGTIKNYAKSKLWSWEINKTGSESCPVPGLNISNIELLGYATGLFG